MDSDDVAELVALLEAGDPAGWADLKAQLWEAEEEPKRRADPAGWEAAQLESLAPRHDVLGARCSADGELAVASRNIDLAVRLRLAAFTLRRAAPRPRGVLRTPSRRAAPRGVRRQRSRRARAPTARLADDPAPPPGLAVGASAWRALPADRIASSGWGRPPRCLG